MSESQANLRNQLQAFVKKVEEVSGDDPSYFKEKAYTSFVISNDILVAKIDARGRVNRQDVEELKRAVEELLRPENRQASP